MQADCRYSEVTVNYSTVTSSSFVITAGEGSFTTYPADLFTVDYPITCVHVLSDTMLEPRSFTVDGSIYDIQSVVFGNDDIPMDSGQSEKQVAYEFIITNTDPQFSGLHQEARATFNVVYKLNCAHDVINLDTSDV